MKIKVDPQAKRFYLAANEWVAVIGHEIRVGKYRFSAVPMSGSIVISDVRSGMKVFSTPMDFHTSFLTATKEDAMYFLLTIIGEALIEVIEKHKDFDEIMNKSAQTMIERLGEMPPIEAVDTDWMFEEVSDIAH
ncbi:hypothetical protein [Halalkalibacterium halodurans]|uniref:Uncharacterized protein n=1 Tax=Halalkalibacterium halodurans TaxID=86665 RepID=A0A0M0KI58_ALKHA|nr:hypothetical protein [Halalkalibacterium halodurans]TPE67989.1 hypothetical protein AMD02_015625 [Halalkalibacterium halodurans]